ncbi:MAG: carbohydrate-binding domain-containing protein, partial [Clostridia bacterium]|nr:carbohydrate-binding domain-containing protein [Clostridia bacterium]
MKKFSAISPTLAFFLVACLCASFLPVMTFAEEAAGGSITVTTTSGETQTISADNTESPLEIGGGTVTYNADAATITLNGITVQKIQFALNSAFTVMLEGDNVVNYTDAKAVYSQSAMTVNGTGTLTVTGTVSKQNLLFTDGDLTVAGGTVNVTSSNTYAVRIGGNFTMTGGSMTVSNKKNNTFKAAGDISVSGGSINIIGDSTVFAGKNIRISGGSVTTTSGNADGDWHFWADDSTYITGGTVTLIGKGYALDSLKGIYLSGGTITGADTTYLCRPNNGTAGVTISIEGTANIDLATSIALINTSKGGSYTLNASGITDKDGVALSASSTSVCNQYVKPQSSIIVTDAFGAKITVDESNPIQTVVDGSVTYNPSENTVTLKNIEARAVSFEMYEDFTVILEGNNDVRYLLDKAFYSSVDGVKMTIAGSGSLKLWVPALRSYRDYQIYSSGDLAFAGGVVNVLGESDYSVCAEGDIFVTGGELTVSGESSVFTGNNILISGGSLTTTSASGSNKWNLWAKNELSVTGGYVKIISAGHALDATKKLSLTGGVITGNATYLCRPNNGTEGMVVEIGDQVVIDLATSTSLLNTGKGGAYTLETSGVTDRDGNDLSAESKSAYNMPAKNAVELLLAPLPVTNYLTVADLQGVSTLFDGAELTLLSASTVESSGAWKLVCDRGDGVVAEYALTIPRLPMISYDFSAEEKGIASGVFSAEFSEYVADNYALCWGTADGFIGDYYQLAQMDKMSVDGNLLSYEVAANVAIPQEATHLWLTADGIRICGYEIPQDRRPSYGALKYRFGLLSDIHFGVIDTDIFTKAMAFYQENGAVFVTTAGDFTLYGKESEYQAFQNSYQDQWDDLPLFTTLGNHDVGSPMVDYANRMKNYVITYANADFTGKNNEYKVEVSPYHQGLFDYTVAYGDDLFVYLGTGANMENTDESYNQSITENQLLWLSQVLEASDRYQNVYILQHFPTVESGFDYPIADAESSAAFSEILTKYPNVINLSGHAHIDFYERDVSTVTNALDGSAAGHLAINLPSLYENEYGYLVTVYETGVLLTGYDFTENQVVHRATFFVANEEPVKEANVNLSATVNGGKDTDVQLIDEDGNVIETVTSVDGVATFTTLTLEDGVYTYTMKQNATNGGGWFYDANEYTITVTVADGVATIEGEAVFTNTDRVPFAAGEIIDGKYIVTETGKATEMGLIKIGDDYYYAGPNGVLVTSQKYFAWRLNENCDITTGWYYFDSTGKLVDSGIV